MDKIIFMIDTKDNDLKIIKQMMIYLIGQDLYYLRKLYNKHYDFWNFSPWIYYNSVTRWILFVGRFGSSVTSISPISTVLNAQLCHHDKENCCAHILYFYKHSISSIINCPLV